MQCHIAYPERGRNPIHDAAPALAELAATEWDRGNEYFQPTSFQISNIHAGTGANNIIPGTLEVVVQFPLLAGVDGAERCRRACTRCSIAIGLEYELQWTLIGEPFSRRRGRWSRRSPRRCTRSPACTPALSTSGGTSDGRFLASIAREVVEFGPLNESIHKIDEHVRVADLGPLSTIYERTILSIWNRAG